MIFVLLGAEYDRHTEQAYDEFRRPVESENCR
jgi:hypothetical protein